MVDNNAENLYNTLLIIYFNQEHMDKKYDPENLLLKGYKDLLNQRKMNKVNQSKKNLMQKE